MIKIKHNGEVIALAKTLHTANNYFKFKRSRNIALSNFLTKPIFSTKYNITVVLEDDKQIWQKNQSIVFLKGLEQNK
jgi:hypothetical protein